MKFTAKVWTGPTQAQQVADATEFTAGTEHVYAVMHAANPHDADVAVRARFDAAGLHGFVARGRDVQLTQWS